MWFWTPNTVCGFERELTLAAWLPLPRPPPPPPPPPHLNSDGPHTLPLQRLSHGPPGVSLLPLLLLCQPLQQLLLQSLQRPLQVRLQHYVLRQRQREGLPLGGELLQ